MKRGTFRFEYTMGFWEAEMLIKALESFNSTKTNEKISKEDLICNLKYQMQEARAKNDDRRTQRNV